MVDKPPKSDYHKREEIPNRKRWTMKLSTKGRYGLRAMLDLGLNAGGTHVALSHIADRQNLSVRYLEQMFSALRKAGLVNSVKGAQGGYTLARTPDRIPVGSILRALEGDLSIIDDKAETDGNHYEACIRKNVWDRLNESINAIVDSLTLQDLMDEYQQMDATQSFIYYI